MKHHFDNNNLSRMKSIILKRHTIQGKVHRIVLYLFGVCVYAYEYPVYEPERAKPIGFIQYPTTAYEVEDEEDCEDE